MENLFDENGFAHVKEEITPQLTEEDKQWLGFPEPADDTPIQILKLAKEVCDYYEAPGMNAAIFESKLFRLAGKVQAELKRREEMIK